MPHGDTFFEIAAILSLATILGVVGQRMRQPLLIMFLATGILAGPTGFGIIGSYDQIELLAQIGIALLLFIVGLKLDLHLIRTIGPVAVATGLGQILFTSLIGFAIAMALGMTVMNAAYVSVALTFSSTIIIVKLLSDKREIESLHGQIAIGFLIVQDIAAILALVGLTTFGSTVADEAAGWGTAALIGAKGLGLLGIVALLMKFVLPELTRRLAHSHELLILSAIAWAVFLGAGGEWLGFSKEVGAFLAGVSLASTRYRDAIGARLTSVRDFLLLFFFVDLGARLDWSAVDMQIGASMVLSVFVLIGNPLIVLVIMGLMGYRRRTAFLAGLTVAQISEFSLIVAALGLSLGHITEETMGLITLVGVVTISVSTYMILYSGPLYRLLAGPLKVFERRDPFREAAIDTLKETPAVDVILVGLGNYGSSLAEYLLRRRKTIIGVDFDPAALEKWRARNVPVLYADMEDPEVHEHLPLAQAQWVVSTVRSRELNLALVQHLKDRKYDGNVALTAKNQQEVQLFQRTGARVVFRPFTDAAEQAADALTHAMDFVPGDVNWPIAFQDLRIQAEASVAGQTIRGISLGATTGVSILAVSRAGRVHYEPGAEFQVFPGDRLLLMGPPEDLREAEAMLNQTEIDRDASDTDRFEIAEIRVAGDSALSGRTVAEVRFRQKYGVTLVGIRRREEQITNVTSAERLLAADCLIVIGTTAAIAKLKNEEPL
ncbi:MAG: cation:proton antiporter [Thermoguttaceae bacterium]|jgi:Kef-type K+ transport system membrane component KefB/Trk K+ transport system NAD-binding subunit|nr:cation:proton antiporter [Thermoguttaceae bacterium]